MGFGPSFTYPADRPEGLLTAATPCKQDASEHLTLSNRTISYVLRGFAAQRLEPSLNQNRHKPLIFQQIKRSVLALQNAPLVSKPLVS